MENTALQFIYIYDALCGWCYGFSPVVKQLYQQYKDKLEFDVIAGGMVMGDQAGPVGEKASFLLEAYPMVEQRTGVRFGQAWIECVQEGQIRYDSFPSAVALEVMKERNKEYAIPFAEAIQKAIYMEGKDPTAIDTYTEIAQRLDDSSEWFEPLYQQEEYENRARANFMYSKQLNVQGFPAAFLRHGDQYWMIAKGYRPMDHMQPLVERFIKEGKL